MNKLLANNAFYDEIASEYDEMISFDIAVNKKRELLKNFIHTETKNAADIGCGSGVDSIALSLLGIKVAAFDPSDEMLKVAKSNSKRMNVNVDFHNCSAEKIPIEFNNNFDLVVSLGNTFANIPENKFTDSIRKCCDILKPNGQLLIQVLNYKKILSDKQRIVNITESKDKFFIRFYDFFDEQIVFNILTFNKSSISDYKLSSTKIYPHLSEKIEAELRRAGFKSIHFYSNFSLSEFNKEQSKDLFIQAYRG